MRRLKLFAVLTTILIVFAIGAFFLQPHNAPTPALTLQFTPAATSTNYSKIIPDDIRMMWAPENRVEFHISNPTNIAILVWTTGAQILTPTGWKTANEHQRNEIIRLKPGAARELCVERPHSYTGPWRAVITYSTEMKGAPLLTANLMEAWNRRSFTNWNGKAWGGGKFSGSHELYTPEVPKK
jgi:hypothetical protein